MLGNRIKITQKDMQVGHCRHAHCMACQYTFMSHRALCCGHLYHATYKAILIPCIWLGNWNRAHKLQICSIGSELKKMEFKRDDYQLSKSYTYSLNIRPWATNLSDLGHLRMSICRKSFKIRNLFTHDWTVCACHTNRINATQK